MAVLALLLSDVYRVVKAFAIAHPNGGRVWLDLYRWEWVSVGPYGRRTT